MTLASLIERVEKAGAGSRELDAEIGVALGQLFVCKPRYEGAPVAYGYVDEDGSRVEPGHGGDQLVRRYTASLDAALALAERVLPGWEFGCYFERTNVHGNRHTKVEAHRWQDVGPEYAFACSSSQAPTPALALVLAVLRAKENEDG